MGEYADMEYDRGDRDLVDHIFEECNDEECEICEKEEDAWSDQFIGIINP